MTKNSIHKLLFTTLFLTLLLISSAYTFLVPTVHAAEPNLQDTTLGILNDVVGINTEKYAPLYSSQFDNQYLNLPQKEVAVTLVSEQGGVRASCSFVNNMLRQIYLSDYEGDLAVEKPATETADMAKGFLQRYQNYAGDSFYGELASTLDNVDVSTNVTKSAGNIKLEVLNWDQTIVDYVWTYTDENGIVAKSKNVILNYDRGQLKVFLNNWPLYTVVGTHNISSEEATAIAIEASKNFSYEIIADNVTSTVTGFKIAPESLGHAALSYLNFPNQSLAREGNPFTLYPSWYVPLGFDKFYPGDVTGMTVSIWADTGKVSIMGPMCADSLSSDNVEKTNAQGFTQESTILSTQIVIATVFSVVGVSIVSRKRVFKSSGGRKLFSRFGGILICGLILFSLFLAAMPTASASEVPNSKARIYASMHGQLPQEQQAAEWVCGQIDDAFEASGYSSSNLCGSGTTRQHEMDYAQYDEEHYDRIAVFHFGHLHWFNTKYRDNYNITISSDDISSKTGEGKHVFVFLWVCAQAYDRTYGMPVAWNHRDGVSHPLMNENGYLSPDGYGQCYISFDLFSPIISGFHQTFEHQITGPCKDFIKYFYDYALKYSPDTNYAVRDALNKASLDFFGCTFTSSRFYTGYSAWWPGSDEFPEGDWRRNAQYIPNNHMKVFGDGAIWLFQPKITLAANYGLSPTFYLSGEPHYTGDIYPYGGHTYYDITVTNVPNYRFDYFIYDGSYWAYGTDIQFHHSGTFTAHYTWDPTYYTLSISSSGGGHTDPTGDQQCLSYSYEHVVAVHDQDWAFDHWQLGDDNMGSNPDIWVYMDGPKTLQAVFAPSPPYKYIDGVTDCGGDVYNPTSLVGCQNDGQLAVINGWGPYGELWPYGWISCELNAQAAGHISVYGYGNGPLYVYTSNDGYDWDLFSTPYVNSGSPYWIDCGINNNPFNYIAFTAEDWYYIYSVGIDSVRVEPLTYHTLTISSNGDGYTVPSGNPEYISNTYAHVEAYGNPGWTFDYWSLDGNNVGSSPSIDVYMDDDHILQANFRTGTTYHWLTVDAYDGYIGNPLNPGIYIDGNLAGYGYASVQVTEDWHTVLVDDPVWNDYIGTYDYFSYFTDGYGNGANHPVYSDTYITAVYYPW